MKRHFEKKALKCFFIWVLVGTFLELGMTQGRATAAPSAAQNSIAPSAAKKTDAVVHANGNTGSADEPAAQQNLKADPKKVPNELDGVGVEEHLGQTLDLQNLTFIDSVDEQKHTLKEYFQTGKPTVLNLVYFECPMLCTLVLNGIKDGMKDLTWSIGKEYNVLTISINPNDTPALAKVKRENYLKDYLQKGHDATDANSGWHFMTGTEDQIKKLASGLGFEYKFKKSLLIRR